MKKGVAQTTTSGKITLNGRSYYLNKGVLTDCHISGHANQSATCETAKSCRKCAYKIGAPLGHSYTAATCTASQKCTRCNAYGPNKALGHNFDDNTCTRCGYKKISSSGSSSSGSSDLDFDSSFEGVKPLYDCIVCKDTGKVDCNQCSGGYMPSGKECTNISCSGGRKDCNFC